MRIKYFKLENFAGIKYGINNSIFELNDIPNGIIMLQGAFNYYNSYVTPIL